MTKPIMNLNDVELEPRSANFAATGEAANKFDAKMGMISPMIGAKDLGCNITSIPCGKRAFPYHNHRVNEEMFLILEGCGEIRIGDAIYLLQPMDIISCPAGGKETAHQIINTGKKDLKFLAISTKMFPEVVEYPDSKKIGVYAEYSSCAGEESKRFTYISKEDSAVDYWDGE